MRRKLTLLLLALSLSTPAVRAQHKLTEDFEALTAAGSGQQGPASLIAAGWTFRNQSSPASGTSWEPGGSPGWAHSGSGWLEASSSATGLFGAALSSWAILPEVPGQAAGDLLSLWVLDGNHPSSATYLDVRYSPTGGTSTGTGPTEVGDFTEVLFTGELSLTPQFVYSLVSAPLPGAGRVALRFHAPAISNFQSSASLYVDGLTVGGEPAPPCGLDLPVAGETVTWDASGGTYAICQDLVVPAGATLALAPGTSVSFDPGVTLTVLGSLQAQGTAAEPVVLTGNNVSGLRVEGDVSLHFAEVDACLGVYAGGSLEVHDSTLGGPAWLSSFSFPCFVRLARCEVRSEAVGLGGTVVLEDVLLSDPESSVAIRGIWNIDGLESFAPLLFGANLQDRVIDGVTVTGVPGAALELTATDGCVAFHLGASNQLAGNDYPVWIRHAGLTADSSVPLTGNQHDAILGFEKLDAVMRGRPSLPDLGLPYHFLERGTASGDVRIAPGSTLLFGPQGGLSVTADRGTDPLLRGLPGQPIRLARLHPGQAWTSLATLFGLTLFEHLEIDGAGVGVVSNGELLLRDCTVSGCTLGAQPAGDGHIFGSGVAFLENQVGLRNDTTNLAAAVGTGIHFSGTERANRFVGNALAAENVPTTSGFHHPFPADGNWWGHPSGPFESVSNPGGQGDPVSFGVDFVPFLTEQPDLSDQRPVVRLRTRLHPVVLPGERLWIEWDAFDDGLITGFDVQVLSPDINAPYQTYVDLVSDLPGGARRCELVVPAVGLHPYERFPFRIVARDDAGNLGFEQFQLAIPHQAPGGSVTFNTPLAGFQGGERITVCYDALGLAASFPRLYLETAADDRIALSAAGSPGTGQCTFSTVHIPHASTDRARLALRVEDNFNRDEWYFSDYFTIRPDARLGDAPPDVQLTSPAPGDVLRGGETVHVTWNASDDVGLRELRLQASFNGGHSFHTVVPSLPGEATGHAWRLPPSAGLDDLRIRVVAVDTLMQNASDGDQHVLRVLPGPFARAATRAAFPGAATKP